MSDDLTRRGFLSTCGVLAASLAACTGSGRGLRSTVVFLSDPAYSDYQAALRALIETVLPADFPIDTNEVERRLLSMFPLEDDRRFLGFQKTLVYFDSLELAPHVAAPLVAAERVALDVPERLSEHEFDALVRVKSERESQATDAFFARYGRAAHFAPLIREPRGAWLQLWGASEFTVKRDFARSVRNLVCIAAYSSERVWPAIGYDGTLLHRPERVS
jgi:hypothetical protein